MGESLTSHGIWCTRHNDTLVSRLTGRLGIAGGDARSRVVADDPQAPQTRRSSFGIEPLERPVTTKSHSDKVSTSEAQIGTLAGEGTV